MASTGVKPPTYNCSYTIPLWSFKLHRCVSTSNYVMMIIPYPDVLELTAVDEPLALFEVWDIIVECRVKADEQNNMYVGMSLFVCV